VSTEIRLSFLLVCLQTGLHSLRLRGEH